MTWYQNLLTRCWFSTVTWHMKEKRFLSLRSHFSVDGRFRRGVPFTTWDDENGVLNPMTVSGLSTKRNTFLNKGCPRSTSFDWPYDLGSLRTGNKDFSLCLHKIFFLTKRKDVKPPHLVMLHVFSFSLYSLILFSWITLINHDFFFRRHHS